MMPNNVDFHVVPFFTGCAIGVSEQGTCAFQSSEMLFLALDQGRRHLHYLPIGQLNTQATTVSIDR